MMSRLLIIISILLILSISQSWTYRIPILINNSLNSNNLIDYQILVTLDTRNLITFGKMRSDCGDIRFIDSDGASLLGYWVESGCNTNNTKIWVKIPFIPANSNKIIYLYYGNPNASSLSNLQNTFVRVIDGLVLSLPFDEGSGNIAYDYSGNGNNGILYDANSTNDDGNTLPQWVNGKYGNALSFDGVDDYVSTSVSSLRLDRFTLVFWSIGQNGTERYPRFFSLGGGILLTEHFAYQTDYTGIHYLRYVNTSGYVGTVYSLFSVSPRFASSWTMFSMVVDISGNSLKAYTNVSITKNVNFQYLPKPINVSFRAPIGGVKMILDEVRIYNRALSAEEIQDLYNNYPFEVPNNPESKGKTIIRKLVSNEPTISLGGEEFIIPSQNVIYYTNNIIFMEIIFASVILALAILILALKNEIWRILFLMLLLITIFISFFFPDFFEIKQACINQTMIYCLEYKTTYTFKISEILTNAWFYIFLVVTAIIFISIILKSLQI